MLRVGNGRSHGIGKMDRNNGLARFRIGPGLALCAAPIFLFFILHGLIKTLGHIQNLDHIIQHF
jgi:hypothetical protein